MLFSQQQKVTVENATQRDMKYKTTLSLIVLATLYAAIFLPSPLLEWLKSQFGLFSRWLAVLTFPIVTSLLSLLLFAQDPLATGESKSARYFRLQYPSKVIKEHYKGCSEAQADDLWFRIFNRWSQENHSQHGNYVKTFQRTYGCRFVYYMSRGLLFFSVLSLVTLVANLFIQQSNLAKIYESSAVQVYAVYAGVLFLLGACSTTVWLFTSNLIPEGEHGAATGCWRKWRETGGISKSWLEQNVFGKASTYQEAYDLASKL